MVRWEGTKLLFIRLRFGRFSQTFLWQLFVLMLCCCFVCTLHSTAECMPKCRIVFSRWCRRPSSKNGFFFFFFYSIGIRWTRLGDRVDARCGKMRWLSPSQSIYTRLRLSKQTSEIIFFRQIGPRSPSKQQRAREIFYDCHQEQQQHHHIHDWLH